MSIPQEYTKHIMCTTQKTNLGVKAAPASEPYPHHHHGDVVRRAPLHRLVGQPVAGGFVAGIHSGLPFPPLDLLVLQGGKGVLVNRDPAPHHS